MKPYQYVFRKGTKPRQVKDAQREVREFYLTICDEAKGAPRSATIAKLELMSVLGEKRISMIEKYAPQVMHSIESAARAYAKMGNSLAKLTMYNMDLYVPALDIKHYGVVAPTIPCDEVVFQAREI